jgi:hypothetical protein
MKRLNERFSKWQVWRMPVVEPLTFTAPFSLQTCVDTIRAHQKMPEGGASGLWIDIKNASASESVLLECKILFGRGNFRPIASYDVELFRITDETTRITARMTTFNSSIATILILVAFGIPMVLIVYGVTIERVIVLLLVFALLCYGVIATDKVLFEKVRRFPGQMRLWLDERASPLAH